jgi:RNA polymerase sigma-70 factor (ECF subfamily)
MTQLNDVLRHLRRAAGGVHDWTDAQLMDSFLAHRDEAAFEVLVRRHGPMVLGVCRRVLRNETDAEDAFQATFLVLARKAAAVAPRSLVGNWLHGVAYHTAQRVRGMNTKRRAKERAAARAAPARDSEEAVRQMEALLDEELNRLPEKYRAPIVLCDLGGKAIKEAARQLGWPQGTLATRLARGRALLGQRLTRRGLACTAGGLAAALAGQAAAGVPRLLEAATVRAASRIATGQAPTGLVSARVAALADGVVKTLLLARLQVATLVLLAAGAVAFAFGAVAHAPLSAQSHAAVPPASATIAKPNIAPARAPIDRDKLVGVWTATQRAPGFPLADRYQFTRDGKVILQSRYPARLTFQGGQMTGVFGNTRHGTYAIDGDHLWLTLARQKRRHEVNLVVAITNLTDSQLQTAGPDGNLSAFEKQ